MPLFERYRVDAVFEHDDHVYKRTHRLKGGHAVAEGEGGVLYLGDGAWGQRRETTQTEEYLAVATPQRHVIRVTLKANGTHAYLAVDPHGKALDRYP